MVKNGYWIIWEHKFESYWYDEAVDSETLKERLQDGEIVITECFPIVDGIVFTDDFIKEWNACADNEKLKLLEASK